MGQVYARILLTAQTALQILQDRNNYFASLLQFIPCTEVRVWTNPVVRQTAVAQQSAHFHRVGGARSA